MTDEAATTTPPSKRGRSSLVLRLTVVAAICGAVALWLSFNKPQLPDGVELSRYESAAEQFRRTYRRDPGHIETLMAVGELAAQSGDVTSALAAFNAVPEDDKKFGCNARLQEAHLLLQVNRAIEAERGFLRFLELAEDNRDVSATAIATARKWLKFIYSVELRLDERKSVLAALHQTRQIEVSDSKQYYFPRLLIWKSSLGRSRLNNFLEHDPDDLLLNIAQGRYLTGDGRLDAAQSLLESLLSEFPDEPRCVAALLECYYEQDDWTAIAKVLASAAPYRDDEPHLLTWMRGELAMHDQRWDDGVIEFHRALLSDVSNPATQMGLAKAYGRLGQLDQQQAAQQKSLVLSQIRVGMARNTEHAFAPLLELVEQCRLLGMTEAAEVFQWHSDRIRQSLHESPGRDELPP